LQLCFLVTLGQRHDTALVIGSAARLTTTGAGLAHLGAVHTSTERHRLHRTFRALPQLV
jgi:hypothetical protein